MHIISVNLWIHTFILYTRYVIIFFNKTKKLIKHLKIIKTFKTSFNKIQKNT